MTELLSLAFVFAKIAVLTFGGGYAMVPVFQDEIVARHGYLSQEAFANLVGLAQVTPGPIGFNAATYAGFAQGGFAGSVAASLGVMIPSLLISLAVAAFLRRAAGATALSTLMRGVRPCVVGVIAAAVFFFADTSVFTVPFAESLRTGRFGVCWQGALVFAFVVFVRRRWPKVNPIWSLLLSGLLGGLLFLV